MRFIVNQKIVFMGFEEVFFCCFSEWEPHHGITISLCNVFILAFCFVVRVFPFTDVFDQMGEALCLEFRGGVCKL